MMTVKFSLIGCLFLFCCCATVKFYNEKDLKTETGIKFYSAKPYLLVEHIPTTSFDTANKSKAITVDTLVKTSVIFLPDLREPQYIKFRPGIGSSDLKINLSNSILTSYGLTTDTKIPETISSMAGMITSLDSLIKKSPFSEERKKHNVQKQCFDLYEFVTVSNGVKLQKIGIIDDNSSSKKIESK